jgi:hypothetical protein
MNELDRYARSWGATAVPFGPGSDTQWITIPAQQRAVSLRSYAFTQKDLKQVGFINCRYGLRIPVGRICPFTPPASMN